jgi:hypothetical protein
MNPLSLPQGDHLKAEVLVFRVTSFPKAKGNNENQQGHYYQPVPREAPQSFHADHLTTRGS